MLFTFFDDFSTINLTDHFHTMYFLIVWLLLPFVYGSVVVQIHRLAIYNPSSSYAFLRNVSFSMNALLESCVWECVYESHCQTAVYYSNEKVCSLFIESCQPYRIHSSGNIQASVICYPKNESKIIVFDCSNKRKIFVSILVITTIATSMSELSTIFIRFDFTFLNRNYHD